MFGKYICLMTAKMGNPINLENFFAFFFHESEIFCIFALEHRLMVLMGHRKLSSSTFTSWLQRKPAGATLWVNNNSIS